LRVGQPILGIGVVRAGRILRQKRLQLRGAARKITVAEGGQRLLESGFFCGLHCISLTVDLHLHWLQRFEALGELLLAGLQLAQRIVELLCGGVLLAAYLGDFRAYLLDLVGQIEQ